jgi:hypothetical protein
MNVPRYGNLLRMEYITQFAKVSEEALREATKEVHRLQALCGYRLVDLLPKSEFGEAQALEILEQLKDAIHSVPSADELLLAAGNRSIGGLRPTSKSDHGYKDCLIWESILTLPAGPEVLLVSRDETAFFDELALAPALVKDAEAKGLLVTPFNIKKSQSLHPVVDALKERFTDIDALMPGDLELREGLNKADSRARQARVFRAAAAQQCGSSSPIRLPGSVGSRSSTSRRYA